MSKQSLKFIGINYKFLLSLIFLLALFLRFLYFPDNIYFGYDQARDAFAALEILHGDLKLIGPTTAFEGLHHGVLYYYILAPLYGLGNMSPEFTAGVWRFFNALGVFLIFLLTKTLFNKKTALVATLLYAVSFEQTQFSIFLHHPSLVVLSMLVMYLGLALIIFSKKNFGLTLVFLGLGCSIQFEFPLLYLVIPLLAIIATFYKTFIKIPKKTILLSGLVFTLSVSTFILAEIKYNFPTLHGLLALTQFNPDKNIFNILGTFIYTAGRMVSVNLIGNWPLILATLMLLIAVYIFLLRKKYRPQLLFLGIWFFSLITTFVVNGGVADPQRNIPLFYPNAGVSVSLLIFVAFLIWKISEKSRIISLSLLVFIIFANLEMIKTFNPQGTIPEFNVQQGMILGDQKKVLDFIYSDAIGQPFAVKAVTMPFFINTTWSYLFEWYGKSRYGYVPIWNGKNALGYSGNLKVQEAQEGLPSKRYVIIEPTRGIAPYLIEDYLKEEGYFTNIIEEKNIGLFIVQKREKF